MPYGYIFSIMLALMLVFGAPSDEPSWGAFLTLFLWLGKAAVWTGMVVIVFAGVRRTPLAISRWTARLEIAAFLPFIADLYLLDLKAFFSSLPIISQVPAIVDLMMLILFLPYLIVIWATARAALGRHIPIDRGLSGEIRDRLGFLVPVLIPAALFLIGDEIAARIPLSGLPEILHGPTPRFVLFLATFVFVLPPIIRLGWRCTPLPPGRHRLLIQKFLARDGVRFQEILLWPLKGGKACTAAVLGIVPRFRYLLVTPCLLDHLTDEEIEAVLAHEVAHIRYRHLLWLAAFIGAYGLLLYRIADPVWAWAISHRITITVLAWVAEHPDLLSPVVALLPSAILMLAYFRFAMGYFMRNFEREADLHVLDIQKTPVHLANSLEKIGILAGGIREQKNWHHYGIGERVAFLLSADRVPGAKKRFERSLRLKKAAFLAVMLAAAASSPLLPVKAWEERADIHVADILIEELSGKETPSRDLLLMAGNVFYEREEYARAVHVLEKAMKVAPDDPEVLNSLAWVFLTAKEPKFLRPVEGLTLAQKAAAIKPAAHILDTLAEGLFLNHRIDEAIKVEKKALEAGPKNPDYYLDQIERFERKTPSSRDSD